MAKLRRALERHEGLRPSLDASTTSTGVPALDRCLPLAGLRRGSLVEYLGHGNLGQGHPGQGASLAFAAACAACEDRVLVVVDRQGQFYPPAWGIELSQTVLIRPSNETHELWAMDQALRCPGVGAVVIRCARLDQRDFRRLQLAAEAGGALGLLVRPVKLRGQPTWADVQWLIEPQPSRDRWRLRVELARCRGGTGGSSVILELDETNTWQEVEYACAQHPPAELADSAQARRRSRA